jgi:hypothetical protein
MQEGKLKLLAEIIGGILAIVAALIYSGILITSKPTTERSIIDSVKQTSNMSNSNSQINESPQTILKGNHKSQEQLKSNSLIENKTEIASDIGVGSQKEQTVKNDVHSQVISENKVENLTAKNIPEEKEKVNIPLQKNTLIFSEKFDNDFNQWEISNSGGDIKIIDDPQKGKILKISRSSEGGDTFLQQEVSRIVRGKKIKLTCQIKLDNVIKNDNFSWGQLCIKFDYDEYSCYNAVQNLYGTKDWSEYKAVKDGSDNFSNTGIESIILIPEKATNVVLYLGLQNTSGIIYFYNLKIVEVL